MSIIIFGRKAGRQIKINKRAEFTFPNKYGEEIESNNCVELHAIWTIIF